MKAPLLLAWFSGLGPYRLKTDFKELLKNTDSHPILPALEVFPSEALKAESYLSDTLTLEGGITLLKRHLNPRDLASLESAVGKFEGGLRLSNCAVELVNTLRWEIQDGQLSFRGKRVLELGCGHGLPGVLACLKGAAVVHFQDINANVLRSVTIPNVRANLELAQSQHAHLSDGGQVTVHVSQQSRLEHRYYAGDWSCMESTLSLVRQDGSDSVCNGNHSRSDPNMLTDQEVDTNSVPAQSCGLQATKRTSSGKRACQQDNTDNSLEGGYDIILMSDTVYATLSLPTLYSLIMKCLRPPYGVMYMAGKKHYFGSGGGTRQFKSLADADGILGAHLITDFTDTSFNTIEVWKFFFH